MKREFALWQLGGFGFTSLGGTLLHFVYEWTGENKIAAIFSGVNESTWEHMKLLFFPMVVFAFVQSLFFDREGNFWWIKLAGVALGQGLIPIIFYTYNGAFGKSPDWLNIAIFFVCAAAAYLCEWRLYKNGRLNFGGGWIPVCILCIWAVAFALLTFYPLRLPLFCDPVNRSYGVGNA